LFWGALVASLLVREEVALTVMAFGLYIIIKEKSHRRLGMVVCVVAASYFIMALLVVMPFFSGAENQQHVAAGAFYKQFGDTPAEALLAAVTSPVAAIQKVMHPIKLANLFMYGLPVLFVPVLAPITAVALANMGLNVLSSGITHTSYMLYYLSPAIAFIFIGAVEGTARLGEWAQGLGFVRRSTWGGSDHVQTGLILGALAATVFFGPSPMSIQFWVSSFEVAPLRTHDFHRAHYVWGDHDEALREIAAIVPQGAIVSAEQHVLPLLFNRRGLMAFPELKRANYVVIDRYRKKKTGVGTVPGSWNGLRENPQFYYDWVELDPNWTHVATRDGVSVYRQVETP
jgi:hypothetical protein